jgi:peptidoglycan/LPS O-acetylase OafA/YrhL
MGLDKEKPSERVEIVEPLRGLAAAAVAWFHFTNGGPLLREGSWLRASGEYGWLGVHVFFVISGFIIPYSMWRGGYRLRTDFGRFIVKRIIRLDPPYLLTVGLAVLLAYASYRAPGFRGSEPNITVPQVAAHFAYLNAFVGYPWLIDVFWTLAIEFQYYILAAIAFPLFAHRSRTVAASSAILFAISGIALRREEFVFAYGGLFALGIVTFQFRAGTWSRLQYIVLLAAAAVCTANSAIDHAPLIALVCTAAALVIAYVRIGRWRVLAFLGTVSYSVYLLHVPIGGRVVNLGSRWATGPISQFTVLVLATSLTLIAAYIMYRFVERPAQRWSSSIRYVGERSSMTTGARPHG